MINVNSKELEIRKQDKDLNMEKFDCTRIIRVSELEHLNTYSRRQLHTDKIRIYTRGILAPDLMKFSNIIRKGNRLFL